MATDGETPAAASREDATSVEARPRSLPGIPGAVMDRLVGAYPHATPVSAAPPDPPGNRHIQVLSPDEADKGSRTTWRGPGIRRRLGPHLAICALALSGLSLVRVLFFEMTPLALELNHFDLEASPLDAALSPRVAGPRSSYGYRRPSPPFEPVRHVPHSCTIPPSSGEPSREVAIPVAVPNVILIGAAKSGTTSIHKIFDTQRDVMTPIKRRKGEAHFFDLDLHINHIKWRSNARSERKLCRDRERYLAFFETSEVVPNVTVVFEKTPSYMIYPSIASAVESICVWKPRILVALRNPVDRAWSHYCHGRRRKTRDRPFDRYVEGELSLLRRNGFLENYVPFDQFERSDSTSPFRFYANLTLGDYARLATEYRGERVHGMLFRGLYAPLLLPWVQRFSPEDRLMALRFEDFTEKGGRGYGAVVRDMLGFAGISKIEGSEQGGPPAWERNATNADMPFAMRRYLSLLYRPFNDLLADLLGEDWRGIWS